MSTNSTEGAPAVFTGRVHVIHPKTPAPSGPRPGDARPRVVVVGGGVSGLACARRLTDEGCWVTVLDRGNRPGGRMVARSVGNGPRVDYGTPYFEVSEPGFRSVVTDWIRAGRCASWRPTAAIWDGRTLHPAPHGEVFVGMPDMGALAASMAEGLEVQSGSLASSIERIGSGWEVHVGPREGEGGTRVVHADWVVIAAPPLQAERVLGTRLARFASALSRVVMQPCWVLVVQSECPVAGFPEVIDVAPKALVARLVREDAKPGRALPDGTCRWLVYASDAWSMDHYATSADEVQAYLMHEIFGLLSLMTGRPGSVKALMGARRWGLARARAWVAAPYLADADERLILCGDGYGGSGVEAAYLSGCAAGAAVLGDHGASVQAGAPELR